MKTIFKILTLSILIISCSQNKNQLSENSIIGQWECVSGCDAEFYVFSESKAGFEFYNYKNQKIFQTGEYQLKDSLLTLFYPGGVSSMFLIELKNDSIFLNNGTIKLKYYTEKTNHTNELFTELEELLKVFPELDFGDQIPVDFTYNSKTFDDKYETLTIAGIKIETNVILAGEFVNASDVVNKISNVLTEQGFTLDELNVSEVCSTYTNESLIVQICSSETNNNEIPKEINIIINFGFIN